MPYALTSGRWILVVPVNHLLCWHHGAPGRPWFQEARGDPRQGEGPAGSAPSLSTLPGGPRGAGGVWRGCVQGISGEGRSRGKDSLGCLRCTCPSAARPRCPSGGGGAARLLGERGHRATSLGVGRGGASHRGAASRRGCWVGNSGAFGVLLGLSVPPPSLPREVKAGEGRGGDS